MLGKEKKKQPVNQSQWINKRKRENISLTQINTERLNCASIYFCQIILVAEAVAAVLLAVIWPLYILLWCPMLYLWRFFAKMIFCTVFCKQFFLLLRFTSTPNQFAMNENPIDFTFNRTYWYVILKWLQPWLCVYCCCPITVFIALLPKERLLYLEYLSDMRKHVNSLSHSCVPFNHVRCVFSVHFPHQIVHCHCHGHTHI